MAAYSKFNASPKDIAEGKHNLASHQIAVALTNTAPVATNSVLGDLTQISYTNLSSRNITTTSSSQSAGVYKSVLADLVLTASGGTVGPFRYVAVFNDTQTSPLKPLLGFYDYGSSITLNAGETLTVDFDQVNGFLQLS